MLFYAQYSSVVLMEVASMLVWMQVDAFFKTTILLFI